MNESVRYRIKHETSYQYNGSVAFCQNQIRMTPQSRKQFLSEVECHKSRAIIEPGPESSEDHQDYHGNRVHTFSVEAAHDQLSVAVESELTVRSRSLPDSFALPSWQTVLEEITTSDEPRVWRIDEFRFDSRLARCHDRFREYAAALFHPERSLFDSVGELTNRIHEDLRYDTQATNITTTAEDAFQLRAGVCQDFAHVQIACLRSLGIPARYVSGYLRTVPPPGKERLIGADESHAWVSVYTGKEMGWVDFDPTNACLCDTNHIPVAIGRDFTEVSPMRGVVLGGGTASLSVSVDVQEISPSP